MTSPQRKRFWFDPRLAIGLVLIVASVAGVLGIVSSADASVSVLAARDSLAPGDRIDEDDLIATSVRLSGADPIGMASPTAAAIRTGVSGGGAS